MLDVGYKADLRNAALPAEVEASYSAIIDGILARSDLNTISAKRIRKGLQEQVEYDISGQKVCSPHFHILLRVWEE
jgi:hypothetical protein